MSLISRFRTIDPKVLYLLVLIVVGAPLIRPINLPIGASRYTQLFYDQVESLKPGNIVLVSFSFASAKTPEFYPQMIAATQHLLLKKANMVFVSWLADDTPFTGKLFTDLSFDKRGLKYGVDYVDLGFIAGGAIGMAAFARDTQKTPGADVRGTPTGDLPLMTKIKSASDFQLLMSFISILSEDFIGQVQTPYKVPLVTGTDGVSFAGTLPYLAAGQIKGILNTMVGAAEYEKLLKIPGKGTSYMDAQQMSHFLMIALIILGNLALASELSQRRKKQ
jgi:hypothetical protein